MGLYRGPAQFHNDRHGQLSLRSSHVLLVCQMDIDDDLNSGGIKYAESIDEKNYDLHAQDSTFKGKTATIRLESQITEKTAWGQNMQISFECHDSL